MSRRRSQQLHGVPPEIAQGLAEGDEDFLAGVRRPATTVTSHQRWNKAAKANNSSVVLNDFIALQRHIISYVDAISPLFDLTVAIVVVLRSA